MDVEETQEARDIYFHYVYIKRITCITCIIRIIYLYLYLDLIEAYYICGLTLTALSKEYKEGFKMDTFLKRYKEVFESERKLKRIIKYQESYSVPLSKSSLQYFIHTGIVASNAGYYAVSDAVKLSEVLAKVESDLTSQLSINLLNQLMKSHKIKKISWPRRRFIQSAALSGPLDWSDEGSVLREKILMDSAYQLVGDIFFLRANRKTEDLTVMIEVLGIPKIGLSFKDYEACTGLVYEFPESAFDVDFLTIKKRAEEIMRGVSYNLDDNYHIVLEGKNLALHFFIQKDYIESQYQ